MREESYTNSSDTFIMQHREELTTSFKKFKSVEILNMSRNKTEYMATLKYTELSTGKFYKHNRNDKLIITITNNLILINKKVIANVGAYDIATTLYPLFSATIVEENKGRKLTRYRMKLILEEDKPNCLIISFTVDRDAYELLDVDVILYEENPKLKEEIKNEAKER